MKGEQEVKKGAKQVGEKAKEGAKKQYSTIAERISRNEFAPKDVIGLSDALVEGIYGQAYRLYNTGKYKDSSQLFQMLIMMNPVEGKYLMGLAACLHMQKQFKSAADTYALSCVLDPKNPIPYFHASDCYMQLGDKLSAIVALEMAIEQAGQQPEFAMLKDRAQLSLEGLKKDYDKWAEQFGKDKKTKEH